MSTKASKKKTKFRDFNYSSIFEHRKIGKKMVPPFNKLPGTKKSSWFDDAAPEMLWAYIVADAVSREEYLKCFRIVTDWCVANLPKYEERVHVAKAIDPDNVRPPACEVEMAELAVLSNEQFDAFAAILRNWPDCIEGLSTLGTLTSLPGNEHWTRCFPAAEPKWKILTSAMVPAGDHQSEITTDIRWLKVYMSIAFGKIRFPEEMKQAVEEILDFPNSGDLRQVRPLIRSTEGAFRAMNEPLKWIVNFWEEVYRRTSCIDSSKKADFELSEEKLKHEDILALRKGVLEGFAKTMTNTALDSRHDGAFGIMLYAISIAEEVCAPVRASLVTGRFGLRTLAELYISFAYLAAKDENDLWYEYRNFGNGQTKLAFLKTEVGDGIVPDYISQESLFEMANEDSWQEFVDVNTGHWASKNLRTLAIDSGTKDTYDKYYDWTSTYSHGHWGAIRDSNFVTCFNSLHRFHRIPRVSYRVLPSVTNDTIVLVNSMLALLMKLYPAVGDLPALQLEAKPR